MSKIISDEEIREEAINLINGKSENLLSQLIAFNRKHGTGDDKDVIKKYIEGYYWLEKFKNPDGEIDVEYALQATNNARLASQNDA